MSDPNPSQSKQQIFTVPQFVHAHPWLTMGGLRSQLFHRKINGLESADAIIKSGRKLLIDGEKYIGWLRNSSKTSEQ